MEILAIGAVVVALLLLAQRKEEEPQQPPENGQNDDPKTSEDIFEELERGQNAAFRARKDQLEESILRITGQRVSLSGCVDDKGHFLWELAKAGGNVIVALTKEDVSCSINTLDNEYLMVLAALGYYNQSLPRNPGEDPPSRPAKFGQGQVVQRTEIPRREFIVHDLRWSATYRSWEYQDSIGIWHLEGTITGVSGSAPEPPGDTPFVDGDRVMVATNLGDRPGTVTGVRWDGERSVHRYSVRLDDTGKVAEYSVNQLTPISGGAPVEPPADHPLRPPQGQPKFRAGDRVKSSSGATRVVADFKYDFAIGSWVYQLEGSSAWWQESLLTKV